MKKKILMPTDFSKNAWHAMTYAIELFKNNTCEFYILNAFQPESYALDSMMVSEPGEKYYDLCKKKSEEGLERVFQMLKERDDNPNHTFNTVSKLGLLIDAIDGLIEKKDIELIIMGTKGISDSKAILGTNTVFVMESIDTCPVLAIPKDSFFKEFKEIVFPTNYEMPIKKRELQHLIDIAKAVDTSVRFLHVSPSDDLNQNQKENQKLLSEYFWDVEHSFHTLHSGKVNVALSNFVESRGSDMIAFINSKHNFFNYLFSESLVKDLGYYSKIPILVLH